ncbi:hypothetical protein GGQ64_003385 [Rhizobium azooxidifex]|uniref:Uncharacterized protein n=1 Tax=Mycoplana azooxidifex TaxID=1636188 RepID=A0A7W6D7J0_9HYPH|nr:hypothetical protein [Mycoplana azooxidifex]
MRNAMIIEAILILATLGVLAQGIVWLLMA